MKRRTFLTLAGSLFCLSALPAGFARAITNVSGEHNMRYKHWKTLCVGRYLIDVPEDAIINFNTIFGDIGGEDRIKRVAGGADEARQLAEQKANELKATRHESKGNMFLRAIPLHGGGVLVHGWEFSFSIESTKASLYIPVKNHSGANIYIYEKDIFGSENPKVLQDLVAFGSSFRPIPQGTIPKEPGFCFDDVIVLDVPENFKEDTGARIEDPRALGLTLSFTNASRLSPRRWLTQFEGWEEYNCQGIQVEGQCQRLRLGRHNIGNIIGEEMALSGHTYNRKYKTYIFEWETPGIVGSKTSPNLGASLLYKGVPLEHPTAPIPFSSDEEALEVWDTFLSTIRIRPVG